MDRRVARLATAHDGVASRAELLALGLTARAIESWARRGRLAPVHRGVYAIGHAALTPRGHARAALLAVGPDAVLSHQSAAALWRIGRASESVHVTVPGRAVRQRAGITTHAAGLASADVTTLHGLRITTPARTIADLAATVDELTLDRAIAEAQILRLCRPEEIKARAGQRGAPRLQTVLAAGPAPTRTAVERAMVRVVHAAHLPRPAVNTKLLGYEVDFLWRPERLVVETDGRASHGTPRAFERDRARDVRLQIAGYAVLRFTYRQLTAEPLSVAARLAEALAGRQAA